MSLMDLYEFVGNSIHLRVFEAVFPLCYAAVFIGLAVSSLQLVRAFRERQAKNKASNQVSREMGKWEGKAEMTALQDLIWGTEMLLLRPTRVAR